MIYFFPSVGTVLILLACLGGCFSIHVEVQRANVVSGRKHVASKRIRGAPSGMSRGAKIIDGDTSGADISGKTFDLPSTPEVHEVQEALKSSSLDLKAVVKDPLPDALNIADTVVSSIERKDAGKQPVEENHVGANPSIAESSGAVQANEGTLGNHCSEHQKDAPRQSLMARSSTLVLLR